MQEQLGLSAEEGEREAAREVDQVIFFRPGMMYFVGADLEPVERRLRVRSMKTSIGYIEAPGRTAAIG